MLWAAVQRWLATGNALLLHGPLCLVGAPQVWTADLDDSSSTMLKVAKFGQNPGSYMQYLPRPKAPPPLKRPEKPAKPASAAAAVAGATPCGAVAGAAAQAAAGGWSQAGHCMQNRCLDASVVP